ILSIAFCMTRSLFLRRPWVIIQKCLFFVMRKKKLLVGAVLLIGALNTFYYYLDGHLIRFTSVTATVKIAIVTVLEAKGDRAKYQTAMTTMECYAIRHNYFYVLLTSSDYRENCTQKDISFRRHCLVAMELDSFDWILFVDADIGVVNENTKLEKFLDPDKDIIFFKRFFNHEITAGSYLVKQSAFSKRFLHGWANYEFSLPKSFHGKDNGALHMWIIKQAPSPGMEECEELWNAARDFTTLSFYTVCCRQILQKTISPHIKVLEKGQAWARDGWLTNSHWNPEIDFMFHARKEADKKQFGKEDIGQDLTH
uniref:Nucleotid_trans domain-containing protein n=1 Tax=Haemonchus contortus TaxID=6289 RepID=A0A7I4XUP7_HAECO